jgi:hypothetical protein
LRRITIQLASCSDAVLGWIVAVVTLIIKRGGDTLIIGRDYARSEHRAMIVLAMVHLGNGVGLHQILISVSDVVNDAKIRLQDCVLIPECRIEFELVTQRGSASSYVATSSDADLIEHVIIEVVLVWSDARLFVRINAQRSHQALHPVPVLHERVNVRRVG